MPQRVKIQIEMPGELAWFRLPQGVQKRLRMLLDKQDTGKPLSTAEKREAKGLADISEALSLLRLRAQRAARRKA
jgi:hypothetical protein